MKMNCIKCVLLLVSLWLLWSIDDVEAKKRRKSSGSKTKTKTKWSTSTELQGGADGGGGVISPVVASEEHGYYVKRTYMPLNASGDTAASSLSPSSPARQSPPFLAVPIAWLAAPSLQQQQSQYTMSLAQNSELQALSAGFLCTDDCFEPYMPLCGRTPFEVAVFYNKCKLNVAKCRMHGLWQDYAYEECRLAYPKEVAHAEQKFRSSPFFREAQQPLAPEVEKEAIVNIAMEALSEIDSKLAEAEAEQQEMAQATATNNANNNNSNNNNSNTNDDNNKTTNEDNNKSNDNKVVKEVKKEVEKVLPKQQNETEKLVII